MPGIGTVFLHRVSKWGALLDKVKPTPPIPRFRSPLKPQSLETEPLIALRLTSDFQV